MIILKISADYLVQIKRNLSSMLEDQIESSENGDSKNLHDFQNFIFLEVPILG